MELKIICLVCLRVKNVRGNTKTVGLLNYTKEVQLYKENVAGNPSSWQNVPIALKEINNVFGRCFFLSTEELATVEQKFQGKYLKHVLFILN